MFSSKHCELKRKVCCYVQCLPAFDLNMSQCLLANKCHVSDLNCIWNAPSSASALTGSDKSP